MSSFSVNQHAIVVWEGGTLDYNSVVQAIGSVGFPIVACVGLFWMLNTTMKEFTITISNLNESIIKLTMKIDGGDK